MQMPPDKTATGKLINAGGFTTGRLNSNKKAKSLLPNRGKMSQLVHS